MFFLTQEKELTNLSKIQVFYFYSTWMIFHQKMLLSLKKLEQSNNIAFFAIDVDYFKGLCKRFNISSIPTILIMKEFREVKRLEGIILPANFDDICRV